MVERRILRFRIGRLGRGGLLVTLPVILLTIIAQREIVAGLSAGELKD